MFQYVLFDLDGTLTDPKEGITKSVQFALLRQGIHEKNLDKLEPFIGPPLKYSFMEFYRMSEEEAVIAVGDYRKRFEPIGIFENKVYPGIPEFLAKLQEAGIKLAVASSKPEPFVKKILEHFSLDRYFDVVVGSGLDGSLESKEEVVEEALRRLEELCRRDDGDTLQNDDNKADMEGAASYETASVKAACGGANSRPGGVMVGDRKFDISGGKEFGLTAVGVAWGYAGKGELEAAGADYIAKNMRQLERFLLDEGSTGRKKRFSGRVPQENGADTEKGAEMKGAFSKTWDILLPFLLYYIGSNACYIVLITMLQLLSRWGIAFGWLQGNAAAVTGMMRIFSMLGGAAILFPLFRRERTNWQAKTGASYLTMGILAGSAALGINILFSLLRIMALSPAYEQAAEVQYQIPLLYGILLYGFISPLAEEMLFRGLVYNRMKKYFSVVTSAVVSSLLFGIYHGNVVQTLYGLILGLVIVYCYEMTGKFKIPVFVHGTANIVVFVLTYYRDISEALGTPFNCVVLLAVSAFSFMNIQRRKVFT